MKIFIILVLSIFLFVSQTSSQDPYNFDLTDVVNITGLPHYRINYFPDRNPPKYHYYPKLEDYSIFNGSIYNGGIHRITAGKTVTWDGNSRNMDLTPPFPSMCGTENFLCVFRLVIIENGGKLIFSAKSLTYSGFAYVVKSGGTVELKSDSNIRFMPNMIILYPNSTFISRPQNGFVHQIHPSYTQTWMEPTVWPERDPFRVASFLCLGCNLYMESSRGVAGVPASFTALVDGTTNCFDPYPKFNISSPFTDLPKIGLVENIQNRMTLNLTTLPLNPQYKQNCIYYASGVQKTLKGFALDPLYNVDGQNFVYAYENSNIQIGTVDFETGSIFVTGPANVKINGVLFERTGITTSEPSDDTVWDGTNVKLGKNIPHRYPLTLMHVTKPVTIINSVFNDLPPYDIPPYSYYPPSRFLLGIIGSSGLLKNNAFILRRENSTGIGFLWGTESFDVIENSFLYRVNGSLPKIPYGTFPDVRPGNTGIYSTSPYNKFNRNTFQGKFQGSSIIYEPILNRRSFTGLDSERLYGNYSTKIQNNLKDIQTIHNKFLMDGMIENWFMRTNLPTIVYPNNLPSLSMRFREGIIYDCTTNNDLKTNNTYYNFEYIFENINITRALQEDQSYVGIRSTPLFIGKWKGLTIINNGRFISSFDYLKYSKFDFIHIENGVFTDIIHSPETYFPNFTSQYVIKNSAYTYIDTYMSYTGTNALKATPDTSIPITQSTFDYTILYQHTNKYNFTLYIDDVLIIKDRFYNFTNTITVPINIINFTPGYHKIVTMATPLDILGPYFQIGYDTRIYMVSNYLFDNYSFYLGIDVSPVTSGSPRVSLPINNQQWTKCQWIQDCDLFDGTFSTFNNQPTSITNGIKTFTDNGSINMLTTTYGNSSGESSIIIKLEPGYYKIYLYFSNPNQLSTYEESLPRFSLKMNDQYIAPLTRNFAKYQEYIVLEPIIIQNNGTTLKSYQFKWGYNKLYTPLAGIEIHASNKTPYSIPIDPITPASTTGGASGTTSGANTGTNNEYTFTVTTGINSSSQLALSTLTIIISIIFVLLN